MGHEIEPCGIPDRSVWKTLSVPFIFTPCFLSFKYECTKNTASSDNDVHDVLQQVNYEEYSQKPWTDP